MATGNGRFALRIAIACAISAGSTSACAAGEGLLVFDWNSAEEIGQKAAAATGLPVTTVLDDQDLFTSELMRGGWDAVVIDNPSNLFRTDTSSAIADFIRGGGKVVGSYWNLDTDPTLQAAFGIATAHDYFAPKSHFDNAGDPSWTGVHSPLPAGRDAWNDDGDDITAASGALITARSESTTGPGSTARGNGGNTYFNAFLYDCLGSLPDVAQYVENQIRIVVGLAPFDCYADCDASGTLTFFDFLCFQNAFAAGDDYADCDNSGAIDVQDFLCFQNAFAAGCA